MALIKSARTHTHPLKTKKLIKVTETYRFNGEPSMARRRDLRRGACLVVACMVAAAAAGGGGGARSNKQASRPISFSRTHNQKKRQAHRHRLSARARQAAALSHVGRAARRARHRRLFHAVARRADNHEHHQRRRRDGALPQHLQAQGRVGVLGAARIEGGERERESLFKCLNLLSFRAPRRQKKRDMRRRRAQCSTRPFKRAVWASSLPP